MRSEGEPPSKRHIQQKKTREKIIIVIINTYGFSDDFLFFIIFLSASGSISMRALLRHSLSHSTVVFVRFRLFPVSVFPLLFHSLAFFLSPFLSAVDFTFYVLFLLLLRSTNVIYRMYVVFMHATHIFTLHTQTLKTKTRRTLTFDS